MSIRHSFARRVVNRQIDSGKVFDLSLPLAEAAEGYRAMDQRHAIKTLLPRFLGDQQWTGHAAVPQVGHEAADPRWAVRAACVNRGAAWSDNQA